MKTKFIILSFGITLINFFSIQAQQRIVLIEQFTNSGCPPCASSSPQVYNFVDTNLFDAVCVAYHTSFPYNDSMYYENAVESNARVSYYSVSGVPYSIVDGNVYQNASSSFLPVMNSIISNRAAVVSKYSISDINTSLNGNNLNTKIKFESLDLTNSNDSLQAFIVVIEKQVQKSSYTASPGVNAETIYKYVMRKMLPNANGTRLAHRGLNMSDTLDFNWQLQHIKSNNEIRIVTFVQNTITKEIYNAALFTPGIFSLIKEKENNISLNLYPNPASEYLIVELPEQFSSAQLQLIDSRGKIIFSEMLSTELKVKIETKKFSKGIYLVRVSDSNIQRTKILILN